MGTIVLIDNSNNNSSNKNDDGNGSGNGNREWLAGKNPTLVWFQGKSLQQTIIFPMEYLGIPVLFVPINNPLTRALYS